MKDCNNAIYKTGSRLYNIPIKGLAGKRFPATEMDILSWLDDRKCGDRRAACLKNKSANTAGERGTT